MPLNLIDTRSSFSDSHDSAVLVRGRVLRVAGSRLQEDGGHSG